MSAGLKVVVASHKPYWVPEDPCYVPVWVNAAARPQGAPAGWRRDDEGDSISAKNPNYCELTALYWAWRNLDAEWLGLAHYRRHFAMKPVGDKRSRVATGEFLLKTLEKAPVVLPRERRYYIETNRSQYVHAHHAEDLDVAREVISGLDPAALPAFDASMARTHGHRFNMFVMRRDLADEWCEWLFAVLSGLEAGLDISSYSANDARVFGFVSERLLDPWVESRGIPYVELPVVNLESQHWVRKGASFLARKFISRS